MNDKTVYRVIKNASIEARIFDLTVKQKEIDKYINDVHLLGLELKQELSGPSWKRYCEYAIIFFVFQTVFVWYLRWLWDV